MPADDGRKRPGEIVENVRARASQARDIRRADTHKPVPMFHPPHPDDEYTDKHDRGEISDDELYAGRSKRPTDKRLDKLESFKDQMLAIKDDFVDRLGKVEVAVADMGGQFKIIPDLIDTMKNATIAMQQQQHVTFTAQVDVEKAQALGAVKVKEIKAGTEAAASKAKWAAILKLVAGVVAVATALAGAFAAGRC